MHAWVTGATGPCRAVVCNGVHCSGLVLRVSLPMICRPTVSMHILGARLYQGQKAYDPAWMLQILLPSLLCVTHRFIRCFIHHFIHAQTTGTYLLGMVQTGF